MPTNHSLRCVLFVGLASMMLGMPACGPVESGEGDPRDASFGGDMQKADGMYSECQLLEVLKYVNESTTTRETLLALPLRADAVDAIIAHRLGPDGDAGTGDDDIFDDLDELDAVDFVGPVVLDFLISAIVDRCEIDLESRPFITADTFAGMTGGGWGRDNVELEATMMVHGITGQLLHDILSGTDDRGRTIFSRIRRSELMEAFSYSYDIDEMPWNGDSHEAREALPFMALSIEDGRFDPDDDGGRRELSLGTDIMDDTYYDTLDYALLRHQMVLRARVRWDNPDSVRRLLIAAKFNPEVGEDGIKRSGKIDVRTEGGTHMASLDRDVMRGMVSWEGGDTALEPISSIYDALVDAHALPTIGTHEGVLLLYPKVHLRGTRSRYHLDLASVNDMEDFYSNGKVRLGIAIDHAQRALDEQELEAQDRADIEALVAMGEGLLDGTLVAQTAEAALHELDPNMDITVDNLVFPEQFDATARNVTYEQLQKNRVVTETIDSLYHEFSENLDDVDRAITGTRDLDYDNFVDMFVEWENSLESYLEIKTTYLPYLERYQAINGLAETERDAQIALFNTFGEAERADGNDDFEDFETVTPEIWDALGRHLEFEVLKITQRQIEGAGTVCNALWFDQARIFYVPASGRPYSNFIIDTMDFTEMLTQEEWTNIPEDERRIDNPIDPERIFHTTLVNEVQIELGMEEPYIERIDELNEAIESGTAEENAELLLEGTHFIFDEFNRAIRIIGELKGDDILDRLEDEGAPSDISWAPADESKGVLALQILADFD